MVSTSSKLLTAYGWDASLADDFTQHAERGLVPGRIIQVDRGKCDVVTANGVERADTTLVHSDDPMLVACTGDWAAVGPGAGGRAVHALLPRRTAIVRSTASRRSEGQVLAANVSIAMIVVSLAVDLDLGQLERYLSLAWESGAQPLVVLTKADIADDTQAVVAEVEGAAPAVQVLVVSAATGEGMDILRAVAASGTTVLLGASGAGKSTLSNALVGAEVQQVQQTRPSDGKGRHTTTTREMLLLPGGGVIIDTPGLRAIGLWDAKSGLSRVFAEIEELAEECRFHDCAHDAEPGCAVQAAVADGTLPERRLHSYRKLERENQHLLARTNARLHAEIQRTWRLRGAASRANIAAKRGTGPDRP